MTRNSLSVTVDVKRIELCDLMLACLAARSMANDGGKKWDRLHDKLKAQLDGFDKELDEMISK